MKKTKLVMAIIVFFAVVFTLSGSKALAQTNHEPDLTINMPIAVAASKSLAISGSHAESNSSATSQSGNSSAVGQGGNSSAVINEAENSHLQTPEFLRLGTLGYEGEFKEDHKVQDSILSFMLLGNGLKPFEITGSDFLAFFVPGVSKSCSESMSDEKLPDQKTVYVFRNITEFESMIDNAKVIGYVDTYSEGKATLMDCFTQGLIDTGNMGGNVLVILKTSYINGLSSSTVGFGTSGATGVMAGDKQASVYGGALGYASSKAMPESNPYLHGIVLYVEGL